MKRVVASAALLAVTGMVGVMADGDQSYFAIFAETRAQKMVGMPKLPPLPPGVKLPKAQMAMMSGAPSRLLNIRLWSPFIAPKDASAHVAPPSGLKQGTQLDLDLYRPKPSETSVSSRGFDPDKTPDFTIKLYWGSSKTVKDGQPKIIRWGDLAPDLKDAMKQHAAEAQAQGSYFYKPGWTTGYWPTSRQPGEIDDGASLLGSFALTTNYAGNVTIDAPAGVDFPAPYEFSSPDLDHQLDFTQSLGFEWNRIPNVLGQFASIMGMEGKSTLIVWTSSEVYREMMMGDMGFLQMAQVRDFVKDTVFMAPERTSVDVPAGIFANADFAMMQMVGYGPGSALGQVQPIPRIQTKTDINVMLGGKQMRGMGRGGHGG